MDFLLSGLGSLAAGRILIGFSNVTFLEYGYCCLEGAQHNPIMRATIVLALYDPINFNLQGPHMLGTVLPPGRSAA